MKWHYFLLPTLAIVALACKQPQTPAQTTGDQSVRTKIIKTEAEWKAQLTNEEYYVLREKGTERAFTGKYWDHKKKGTYTCTGCGNPLFESSTKFKSGTGWPSFYDYATDTSLVKLPDHSHGWNRTEVICARCDGHLGHVFNDGPKPTGLRYCINSVSLNFSSQE